MGSLYTSYFAKVNKGVGLKFSISRFNPQWLNFDLAHLGWLPKLAPSKQLLTAYKSNSGQVSTWEEYARIYRSENPVARAMAMLEIVELLAQGHDITLYCYETPNKNCHRHILAKMFQEKYNIEVRELDI